MTREELDFIGAMNMCDEISNEAYKKIVCHCREQEPCEDCISRQAAIEAVVNLCKHYTPIKSVEHPHMDFVIEALQELPPVTPQSRTGHWIMKHRTHNEIKHYTGQDEMGETHTISVLERYETDEPYCSECGKRAGDTSQNYCCACGAKMVELQESEE